MSGLDYAAHAYGLEDENLFSKLNQTERIIE